MSSNKKTIVVCGATGKQGGAVLNALLESRKWNLIALSRIPESKNALELKSKGIEIRYADLQDKESLNEAFKNAYGVYGVTTPLTSKGKIDTKIEKEQGFNIADACMQNRIKHLVLSTVLYVREGQENSLEYIRSKFEIEKYVESNDVPFTLLRPASFMDEIGGEYLPVKKGVITGQADGDAKVPYIACRDIGKFAGMAFENPEKFIGKKLNLIGDFISGDELAQVLSRVCNGKPFKHKAPPMLLMWIFARIWIPLRKQFEEWGRSPYPESIETALKETRSILPEAMTFADYLHYSGWDKKSY